jgi:twitching motility protein PilT
MSHWIDPFLQLLTDQGAEALFLGSGELPLLRQAGTDVAAARQSVGLEHLLALARGALGAEDWHHFESFGQARWSEARGPLRYRFDAVGGPGRMRLEIRPEVDETESAAAAPAAAAPAAAPEASNAPKTPAAPPAAGPTPPGAPPAGQPIAPAFPTSLACEAGIAFVDELLRKTHGMRASDLHLTPGLPPMVRLDGRLQALEGYEAIPPERLRGLLLALAAERNQEELETLWDTDFAREIPGLSRFRVNVFTDRLGLGAAFRVIPNEIPKPEQLGLPPKLVEMTQLSKGIVLVTGPTGSGKSTTLAALVDHINETRHDHVITLEDPIEFVHSSRKCLIHQREIGTHAQSFKRGLREALREDPDVVLVGEMRDLETVHIALETAETGHLVFGTLHTTSGPATVDRLIDQFPAAQQQQIRVMLADTLRCVVAQVLCRRKGGGRVAALELMVSTPAIANLIREGKTHQMMSIMLTSKGEGMQTMTDALAKLVEEDIIDPEEALARATDREDVFRTLERRGLLDSAPAR